MKVTIKHEAPKLVASAQEINHLMEKLGCTRREAIDIIKADKEVDKMSTAETTADLTDEQKKAVKSATIAHTKKRTPVKRERKIDQNKAVIMDIITDALIDNEILITKQKTEGEQDIRFRNEEYTIRIIKHRPPKN